MDENKVFLVWLTDSHETYESRDLKLVANSPAAARKAIINFLEPGTKIVIEEAYINEYDSGSKFEVYDFISGLEYVNPESQVDHIDLGSFDLHHRRIINLNRKYHNEKVQYENENHEIVTGRVQSIYYTQSDDTTWVTVLLDDAKDDEDIEDVIFENLKFINK